MFKYKSLLAAATLVALIMVGCNENTTTPAATPPNPITGLMATSINDSTVRLKWTAPTGTYSSYIIRVNSSATDTNKLTAPSGTGTFDVSGLAVGTAYTFSVTALNSDNLESTSTKIKWAGASRFTSINGNEILLYETSSLKGSGLRLYNPALKSPEVLDVSGYSLWDFAIENATLTDSVGAGSPGTLYIRTEPRRVTMLGTVKNNVNSLDEVFETGDLTVSKETAFDIPNVSATGFAFVLKTADGNFAKVLIKSVGGKILQDPSGTGKNRFCQVEISYQTKASVPHADKIGINGN